MAEDKFFLQILGKPGVGRGCPLYVTTNIVYVTEAVLNILHHF